MNFSVILLHNNLSFFLKTDNNLFSHLSHVVPSPSFQMIDYFYFVKDAQFHI